MNQCVRWKEFVRWWTEDMSPQSIMENTKDYTSFWGLYVQVDRKIKRLMRVKSKQKRQAKSILADYERSQK